MRITRFRGYAIFCIVLSALSFANLRAQEDVFFPTDPTTDLAGSPAEDAAEPFDESPSGDAPAFDVPRLRETSNTPWSRRSAADQRPVLRDYDPNRAQFRTRERARVVTEFERRQLTKEERSRFAEVSKLKKQIRDEKSEDKRTELGEQLRTKLGVIFDEDLNERDTQLKKLEARVEKLRAAVEKRRKNRDRVITVQVDSVMLAAEGLGFPILQDAQPQVEWQALPRPQQVAQPILNPPESKPFNVE